MLVQIQRNKQHLEENEFNFLINTISITSSNDEQEEKLTNPFPEVLNAELWNKVLFLSKTNKKFAGLPDSLISNKELWQEAIFDPNIHFIKLPPPFEACTFMQRLCILKVIRPDKVNTKTFFFFFINKYYLYLILNFVKFFFLILLKIR